MSQPTSTQRRNAILASLSASAAAMTATGSRECEAQLITVSVNKTVGFAGGDLSNATAQLPGTQISFIARNGGGTNYRVLSAYFTNFQGSFRGTSNGGGSLLLRKANAGQVFSTIGVSQSGGGLFGVASRSGPGYNNGFGDPAYYAFRFTNSDTSQTNYGYINATFTNTAFEGYDITINSLVYDVGGGLVPMGSLPAVPEPSPAVLGALASLAAGAPAVRKWLKGRAADRTPQG